MMIDGAPVDPMGGGGDTRLCVLSALEGGGGIFGLAVVVVSPLTMSPSVRFPLTRPPRSAPFCRPRDFKLPQPSTVRLEGDVR